MRKDIDCSSEVEPQGTSWTTCALLLHLRHRKCDRYSGDGVDRRSSADARKTAPPKQPRSTPQQATAERFHYEGGSLAEEHRQMSDDESKHGAP